MKKPAIKVEAIFTTETREPSTTIVCNLKEHEGNLPWVFKCGSQAAEKKANEISKLHSERKEWLRPLAEFIIENMRYSPVPERPFGYDQLFFAEAVEAIVNAFREKYTVAIGAPAQQALTE